MTAAPEGLPSIGERTSLRERVAESLRTRPEVAQRFLDLLNEFNLERRQSQAAAERKFVEGRLAEVQANEQVVEVYLGR